MKKVRILILTFIVLGAISSCKKGENDPFISIRSRDARITGKWKVVNLESNYNSGGEIYSSILNGSILTQIDNGSSSSYSYSANWEINSDGTLNTTYAIDGSLSTDSETWYWLDDSQKKSKIMTSEDDVVYVVDRLTNKELVLKYELSGSNGNEIGIISSTITFEKE
jgi:hypothetical protein